MQISFYTIKGDEKAGWDVVKKSFPTIKPNGVLNTTVVVTTVEHCTEKQAALNSAMAKAIQGSSAFIKENESVITISPFFNNTYAAFELTPDNGVKGCGNMGNFQSTFLLAQQMSETKKCSMLVPPALMYFACKDSINI